jgi:hypothetical protein
VRKTLVPAALAAITLAIVAVVASGAAGGGDSGAPVAGPTELPATARPPMEGGRPSDPATPAATEAPSPDAPPSGGRAAPTPVAHVSTPGPGRKLVLAPIDAANVAVLESYPPRYVLQVQAGLPGGCASPSGYEVERAGDRVRVSVFNTLPSTPVPCTLIYGRYDLSIDLGSAFTPGREYAVEVNGKQITFPAR